MSEAGCGLSYNPISFFRNHVSLTLLRLFVETYTMFPAVRLSLSTKVRALGSGVVVYKSMVNPGGRAIVSSGKLNVCPAMLDSELKRKAHSAKASDLGVDAMPLIL